jgi:hypothetical protein
MPSTEANSSARGTGGRHFGQGDRTIVVGIELFQSGHCFAKLNLGDRSIAVGVDGGKHWIWARSAKAASIVALAALVLFVRPELRGRN